MGGGKDKVFIFEQKDVVEIAARGVYFDTEAPAAGVQQNGMVHFIFIFLWAFVDTTI